MTRLARQPLHRPVRPVVHAFQGTSRAPRRRSAPDYDNGLGVPLEVELRHSSREEHVDREDGPDEARASARGIGIYELTSPNSFGNLSVIKDFTLVFHEFASRYIQELGRQTGSRTLRREGTALAGNLGETLSDLNPAREEIMWQNVQRARSRGYLLVGMGDAHRVNLQPRLTGARIPNEEVEQSLLAQQAGVNATWVL